jgi:hypothetical protein
MQKNVCEDKGTLALHHCKVGFMSGYEVWMHHGELVCQTTSVVEEDDRMDEMFDVIRLELQTNHEDTPTPEVQNFFNILRDSEVSLH